jgi:uncharacterized protein YndB with AHSA1/START domain
MTPDRSHRIELRYELPGTPEQVWQAIATAVGISSWMLPTDLEENVGGSIVTHMGETSSAGKVTGWDPPHRFAYEEPDWAELGGHAGEPVTPLATEFLIEAASGGTCVLRVVSSAFGTGAQWEQEFFDDMERYWAPTFDHLRLYLTHFAGQQAHVLEVGANIPGTVAEAIRAVRRALGVTTAGSRFEANGLRGSIERSDDVEILGRLAEPDLGFVAWYAFPVDETTAYAGVRGYFFGDGAADRVGHQLPVWQSWFERLPAEVG